MKRPIDPSSEPSIQAAIGARMVRCRIPRDAAGLVLLDFLVQRFTYHSRADWSERLVAGRVELGGRPATGTEILAADDVLDYHCGDIPEPPVPLDVRVVHEDEDLLVVAKPPGLPVHPAGHYFAHTLWGVLRARGYDSLHFLSRLDRETSGLLLVARNSAAAARYQRLAGEGGVGKTYLVAVEGDFPESLDATGWLEADSASVIRKKRRFSRIRPDAADAQDAATHFRCLCRHDGLSLVQAELATGRTHQIRATLCSLGFPVVGDKIYGRDETWFLRFRDDCLTPADRVALRLDHQALHAWRLTVRLPGQTPATWTAPPPDDLAALFPFFPAL